MLAPISIISHRANVYAKPVSYPDTFGCKMSSRQKYDIIFGNLLSLRQIDALNRMGHAIGLHGYYHAAWSNELDHGLWQLTEEERLLNQYGITLSQPVMVRAPFLGWGKVPIPDYKSAFYYDADIVSDDDKGLSAQQIVNSVISQLQNKGYPNEPIILLHSTVSVETYKTIINPTPDNDLIAKLQENGYTIFKVLPRPSDSPNRIIGSH